MSILTLFLQLVVYIAVDIFLRYIGIHDYILRVWEALFFTYFGYTLVLESHTFIKHITELSTVSTDGSTLNDSSRRSSRKSITTGSRKQGNEETTATSLLTTVSTKDTATVSSSTLSTTVQPIPVYVQEIIKDIIARRIPPSSSTTVVNFAPYELVIPYPFEVVVHALKNKFQLPNDPLNPTIREVRLIQENTVQTDHTTNYSYVPDGSLITVRKREIIAGIKEWIPTMLRWAISIDSLIIEEEAQLFHTQRMFRVTIRNRDLQNIGRLQDQALYRVSESNPDWTIYTSYMDFEGINSIGSRLVNLYVPKPGQPVATSENLVAAHVKILNSRLWEFNGAPKQ